ncbi:MAG: hypothetical protein FWF33_07275, partial [Clostridiales bacterium]|nr:hypothetical protein [Clostridiales bacterium]
QTLRQETAIKNPVVIERICEVDLLKGGWQTQAVPLAQSAPIPEPADTAIDPDDAKAAIGKIDTVQEHLDSLLATAREKLEKAQENAVDAESFTALKNVVLQLEKDTIQLAGELTDNKNEK